MPATSEKPGKGRYKCTECGKIVVLNDTRDTLPPCSVCENTEFIEVG